MDPTTLTLHLTVGILHEARESVGIDEVENLLVSLVEDVAAKLAAFLG